MPSASQKVGKSLLKYFRPVRVGHPEQDASRGFERFQPQSFRKQPLRAVAATGLGGVESREGAPSSAEAGAEAQAAAPPSNWLDLVVQLLSACKRSARNSSQRIGTRAYQDMLSGQVRQKIQVTGSIINTTTEEAEEIALERAEEEKKAKDRERLAREREAMAA